MGAVNELQSLYQKYGQPIASAVGNEVSAVGQDLKQAVVQPAEQFVQNKVVAPVENYAQTQIAQPFHQFLLAPNNPYANGPGQALLGGLDNAAQALPTTSGVYGVPDPVKYLLSSQPQRQQELQQAASETPQQYAQRVAVAGLTGGIEAGAADHLPVPQQPEAPVEAPAQPAVAKPQALKVNSPAKVQSNLVGTLQNSGQFGDDVMSQVDGTHDTRNTQDLVDKVKANVAANPNAAIDTALKDGSDEAQLTAIHLAGHLANNGDPMMAADLLRQSVAKATEGGRSIQALSTIDPTTPEGQSMGAARMFDQYAKPKAKASARQGSQLQSQFADTSVQTQINNLDELAKQLKDENKPVVLEKVTKLQQGQKLTTSDFQDLAKAKMNIPVLTGDKVADITERANAINAMPEGTAKQLAQQKLWEHIGDMLPTGVTDKALTLRRAGLLSAPKTLTKVLVSHMFKAAAETASNAIGAGIDKAIGTVSGQRGIVLTPRGIGTGTVEGAANMANRLVHGLNPEANFEDTVRGRVTMGKGPVGKVLQAGSDAIGRVHASIPDVAHAQFYNQSLNSQALAAAKTAGLKGAEEEAFVQKFLANPSDDAQRIAKENADRATYQNETTLNKAAQGFVKATGPVGKFLVPFTRVPSAIADDIVSYSPVGAVRGIANAFLDTKGAGFTPEIQAKLSQALGRSIVGTGASWIAAEIAKKYGQQYVSLTPANAKEKALWQAQGRPDNSIYLNGKWHTFASFGPVGTDIALGVSFAEGLKDTKKTPGSLGRAALTSGEEAGNQVLDSPFLTGVNSVTSALQNPQEYGQTFANTAAGSVVPSALANVASAQDPSQRIVNSPLDAIKYRVPGLRETLPAETNVLGQSVPNPGGFVKKLLDPTDASPGVSSPAVNELTRLHALNLDATPSLVGKTVTTLGVEQNLTPAQTSELQGVIGKDLNAGITQLIGTSQYQALSDPEKQAAIQKLTTLTNQRDNIAYAASHQLPQSNLTPAQQSAKQGNEQLKLKAAQAYQQQDGQSFYKYISQLPKAQQTSTANEIQQAMGTDLPGKDPNLVNQVLTSLQPAAPGVDASQVGAAADVNDYPAFQRKRQFEQYNPDHDPIYDLPDDQAQQVLIARSQSVDGQTTPLAKAIKAEPWYQSFSTKESAWYDANPSTTASTSVSAPKMSASQIQAAAEVAALPSGSKSAFYDSASGKDLLNYYSQLDGYDATKLEAMGATAQEVAQAQASKITLANADGTTSSKSYSKSTPSSIRRAASSLAKSHVSTPKVSLAKFSGGKIRTAKVHAPKEGKIKATNYKVKAPSRRVSRVV